MKIVIDKDSLIKVFTVALYAICGGDYIDTKNTVTELLEKVKYTELPKEHGRLIDGDALRKDFEDGGMSWEANLFNYAPTIIEAERSRNDKGRSDRGN